ncbi:MAG: DUF2085 domain-containing protein [Acidobacteria bacterium]|nr:DUF2085 domain-containing protein [Acidobacteriota bacterium]MBV9478477.1 DUF2085 domain-containing protein [Acidobacteriota bacterium]
MMRRDTKIVFALVGAVPVSILAAATLCSWAIARGASMQWRLLFRMLCHGIPRRCFELFGAPMPICARCTGIYIGMLGGMCAFLLLPAVRERFARIAAFAAVTPLAIDGLTQLAGLRESVNPLRLATGLVAGLAFGFWILTAVEHRDDALLTNP